MYGDPSLSEFHTERDLKGRLLPAPTAGKQRPSLGESSRIELKKQLAAASTTRSRKRALEADKENEAEGSDRPAKVRKTRMSMDQRLALGLL
ncbi:hypothetical protein R3P38DRAFT_2567045 [Favolaschia claudopus]|uniref:Uncharacterized protein n=1 Tax=Favolaschia claudopus TaxID=2862362 RepID=A0AAV9ZWZ1_9AGAR